MRLIVMLIVLSFPVLDVLATMRFARWTGIPTLAWLAASAVAGALLLRSERMSFRARTQAALRGDQPLLRGLLDSGRRILAALLLILPGVISDVITEARRQSPLREAAEEGEAVTYSTETGVGAEAEGDRKRKPARRKRRPKPEAIAARLKTEETPAPAESSGGGEG